MVEIIIWRKTQRSVWKFSTPKLILLFLLSIIGILAINRIIWIFYIESPHSQNSPTHSIKSSFHTAQRVFMQNDELQKDLLKVIEIQKTQEKLLQKIMEYTQPKYETQNGSGFVDQVPCENKLSVQFWNRTWKDIFGHYGDGVDYLDKYQAICEIYDSLDAVLRRRGLSVTESTLPLCPCVPGTLCGHHKPDVDYLKSTTWSKTLSLARTVVFGGYWKPEDCLARRRVAVIIPCRDRETHLRVFLMHTHPLLQRQLLEYRVFAVEQVSPTMFNKASSMNAAFIEVTKLFKFDCIMFHDVDLLAEDDRSIIHCGEGPVHLGANLDVWNYTVMYSSLVGGAISMTWEQFVKINGYPNDYFGWGGEDDELYMRVEAAGLNIIRPPATVSRHTSVRHEHDLANPLNQNREDVVSGMRQPNMSDGLATIQYETADIFLEPLFTLIKVNLVMKSALSQKLMSGRIKQKYFKVRGGCHPSFNRLSVLDELPVSLTTCRYQCDLQPDCKGFMYHEKQDIHCVCLSTICSVQHGLPDATLYIKDLNEFNYMLHFNSSIHYRSRPGGCIGNDLHWSNRTLPQCVQACSNHKKCAGFVYVDVADRACWLKKKLCSGRIKSVLGVTTYTKRIISKIITPARSNAGVL